MPLNFASDGRSTSKDFVYDILCVACTDIFQGYPLCQYYTSPVFTFHSLFSGMKTAAHNGCHLCSEFLAAFGSQKSKEAIPDTCPILTKLFLCPDSQGQNMARLVLHLANPDRMSRDAWYFNASRLNAREKANIEGRRFTTPTRLAKSSLNQIKQWLATCVEGHSICRDSWTLVSNQRTLPTRLLEITKFDESLRLRVIDTAKVPSCTQYLTLSHCWGTKALIRLTSETYHSFQKSIAFEALPRTFQDAATVTQLLGFTYLWIDSLCIIQDSHDDWLHESSMMGSIYAQGHLNIAATYSENGDGGLFNQPNDRSGSPCIFQAVDDDGIWYDYVWYQDDLWQSEVENAPLGKRAWVVQERVLAPRLLHFASSQIFWECCQDRAAELLPRDSVGNDAELKKVSPYPGTREVKDPDRIWVYKNWAALVTKYSSCNLTVESDKLVAISGLARRVCGQLGLGDDSYVIGHWKTTLPSDLLWRVGDNTPFPERFPGRAPTWSWASINGSIQFFFYQWDQPGKLDRATRTNHTQVLDILTRHHSNPFGQFRGGGLRLRGPLSRMFFEGCDSEPVLSTRQPPKCRAEFRFEEKNIHLDQPHSSRETSTQKPLLFLLMIAIHEPDRPTTIYGMLLRPTEQKRGQFERVGVAFLGQVSKFEKSLKNAMDPSQLSAALYEEADSENGFTIELV